MGLNTFNEIISSKEATKSLKNRSKMHAQNTINIHVVSSLLKNLETEIEIALNKQHSIEC